MKQKRVVILGAGFGGLLTALRLFRKDPSLDIVLVDKKDIHVYKPWLYDVATSMLVDPERQEVRDLAQSASLSTTAILVANKATSVRFRKGEVSGVDVAGRHVLLRDDTTLSYDALVVAVGAEVNYFNIPGMETEALPLATLQDAMKIRSAIEKTFQKVHTEQAKRCTIVIVGAGPTGTESAAELGNFLQRCDESGMNICGKCRIVLLDAGDAVLGPLSPFTQTTAKRRLEKFKVEMHVKTLVTEVTRGTVHAKGVETEEQILLPYDVLIWAGGVKAHSMLDGMPVAKTQRGRLKTDQFLRVEQEEYLFAVGDCAAFTDEQGRELPPTAWAAVSGSRAVADNVLASLQGTKLSPFKPYKQWPAIVTLGGRRAVAEVSGWKFFGRVAFVLRRLVDLRYFLQILPFFHALVVWKRGVLMLAKND